MEKNEMKIAVLITNVLSNSTSNSPYKKILQDILVKILVNPFKANALFLYPLKTSENLRFSDIFKGYKNILGLNGLIVTESYST